MPDIIRVRWLGDAAAFVTVAGRNVEPDEVFDLPGRVVEDLDDADHVVIEVGNPPDVRLLQRELFRVESGTKAKPSTAKKE